MFNVSALLLDDALKQATPLTNGAINETLRQFAPLSDYRLLELVDCRESSTLIDRLLKIHTLPETHRRTCGVRTLHSSMQTRDPQTAQS